MLKGGIPIGKIRGISLRLNYSWFIIFVLVTWALSASYYPENYPGWNLATKIAAGMITSILFFGSVLIHELMHSVVAQRRGIPVRSITLFIFGGVAEISNEPKRPKDEFSIALAGPLTSLTLGIVFVATWFLLEDTIEFIAAIAFWLGWINITLAFFNLIPGFPLDGGRVLRSLLWWRSNDLRKATKTASNIGRVIGYLFIFAGIFIIFRGNWFDGLWLAFIGWFLESAASGSYQQLLFRDLLQNHTVSELMTRDFVAVSPDLNIERLVNEHILTLGRRGFPVVTDNRVLGFITLHDIKEVPRNLWHTKRVADIMTPFDKVKWVRPDADLSSVLRILTEEDINQAPVVMGNSIVGIISRDSVLSFVRVRGELGMQ